MATRHAKETFDGFVTECYKAWLYKARCEAMKKANVSKIDDKCKEFPPKWAKKPMWDESVNGWKLEQWQITSEKAIQNRLSSSHMTYTGGSRTVEGHRNDMV